MAKLKKDKRCYWRGKLEHSSLIIREVAYNRIYLKNKEDYSLPFREYDIHYKDGGKDNNVINNLDIVTRSEHELIHNSGLRSKKEFYEYMHKEQIKERRKYFKTKISLKRE